MRGSFCQTSLCTAYYRGTQCSRLRRIRAEPVCRINWIRWHGTFPSYRLCRKLQGPFSYAAGNAASYTLALFRQDGAWICWTEDPRGQARKSRNETSSTCNAIMYEQYII